MGKSRGECTGALAPDRRGQRALADDLHGVQAQVLQVEHQLDAAVGADAQGPDEQVLAIQDEGPGGRAAHPQAARALGALGAPVFLLHPLRAGERWRARVDDLPRGFSVAVLRQGHGVACLA